MLEYVEDWARGQGATHLSATVSERHPHSRPWAERRGSIKLVAIQYAMAQGVPYLRTNNNSKNAPTLAVNRAFGHKPEPGFFEMVKHLD